jgi:disulfide bond formation protein DsbB
MRRQSGRLAALALVFVLSVISIETAVHSVHHLSDPQSAASCQVFSGSQHVPGTVTVHADLWTPRLIIAGPPALAPSTIPPDRFARPDEGRAPPASPSA